MKKLILGFALLLFTLAGFGQNGVTNVIVEKYYVSNSADVAAGVPAGSVSYRIWVDLESGWKLNNLYGNIDDSLVFRTTTTFYNSADGARYANDIAGANLATGAAMIDSWVSLGAAADNQIGSRKADDANGSLLPVAHPYLQNNSALAGIPINTTDGIVTGDPATLNMDITTVGITTQLNALNSGSALNKVLFNSAGGSSWASLNGATGVGTDNLVLVGQFTTAGDFNFKLNFTVQNIAGGNQVAWVHSSPDAGAFIPEVSASFLMYSNQKPAVAITSPAASASFTACEAVVIEATASDPDAGGTITQVEFFLDGTTSLGVDNAAPFTATWAASVAGTHTLTAVATDNDGNTTTSTPVSITVNANPAPTIGLAASSTTVFLNQTVTFTATPADNGSVANVKFYDGLTQIGTTLTAAPWEYVWTATPAATHSITAKVTDNCGSEVTSSLVSVVVNGFPAPVVDIWPATFDTIVNINAPVTLNATATVALGTIAQVEFLVNGTPVHTDNSAPYSYVHTFTATGVNAVSARATTSNSTITTSAPRQYTVIDNSMSYEITNQKALCNEDDLCMTVSKINSSLVNCIGFDLKMSYDKSKVTPTGVVTLYPDLLSYATTNANYTTNIKAGTTRDTILISIFLNPNAPANMNWHGTGNLCCVQFNKKPAFAANESVSFDIKEFRESYYNQAPLRNCQAGTYSTKIDSTFAGSLVFWNGGEPISYVSGGGYLLTQVLPSVANTPAITPDFDGLFSYNLKHNGIANDYGLRIQRDVANATDVMAVVNGADAVMTKKVLVNDMSFVPSVYQIIAMDVNQDGVVSAGDLTQINHRTVLRIDEYKSVVNYPGGVYNNTRSKDWVWIASADLDKMGYGISATYPFDDNFGYSKYSVPVPDSVKAIIHSGNNCPEVQDDVFTGIMIGDVNGNYKDIDHDGLIKSGSVANDDVVIHTGAAIVRNNEVEIPVSVSSNEIINAVDFAVNFSDDNLTFVSVENQLDGMQSDGYYTNGTLRVTSYSLNAYPVRTAVMKLKFQVKDATVLNLNPGAAYTNGNLANLKISAISAAQSQMNVLVYPNPANSVLFVQASADSKIQLVDMSGRIVGEDMNLTAGQIQSINTSLLSNGVYYIKANDGVNMSIQKVVITR